MKKIVLNYLVIAALVVLAAFTSCGGSNGGGGSKSSSIIVMTTEHDGVIFHLSGSGTVMVDWGDGSEKDSLTLNGGVVFRHFYPNESIRTITINGDNITKLIFPRTKF